ncbi:LptF/LptG family permease [Synechococcus sp. M16CYN]|uniref:LptF/LptG family permease n=1 Tax=Synechococcus sp. M16CYN TaxID=3103139 RepID=UPI00325441F0
MLIRKVRYIHLLDRWLLAEIIAPLLFAVAAFTVLGLSIGVMFELARRLVDGLPISIALQLLLLNVPRFLVLSLPMSSLFATLFAYSKLSANSELKALHSVGISTIRLVVPALILSLSLTGLTLVLNDVIVPRANTQAELTLQKGLGRALATEQGKDITFNNFGRIYDSKTKTTSRGLRQLFYSRCFKKGEMIDVTLLDFSRTNYRQMWIAQRATWNESQAMWEFFNGQILTLNPNGSTTHVAFDQNFYPLNSGPLQVAKLPDDANNMTFSQAITAERIESEAGNVKAARKLRVRIQEKFTLPMACLVFGLIGSSLGARPGSRTSKSQGFGVSILLILGYYALSISFSSLGISGILPPLTAAWLPVLISLGFGGLLLYQVNR